MPTPYYPKLADVLTNLTAFNVLQNAQLNTAQQKVVQGFLDASVREWENVSGYTPFLVQQDNTGAPVYTTRVFDTPGGESRPSSRLAGYSWYIGGNSGRANRLYCGSAFTACSEIRYNVTPTYDGDILHPGQDYMLYPANAPQEGRPYDEIQFLFSMIGGMPQSIHITAKFGFCESVPDDAFTAIILRASAKLLPHIELLLLGDQQTVQEKDEKVIMRAGQSISAYTTLSK